MISTYLRISRSQASVLQMTKCLCNFFTAKPAIILFNLLTINALLRYNKAQIFCPKIVVKQYTLLNIKYLKNEENIIL